MALDHVGTSTPCVVVKLPATQKTEEQCPEHPGLGCHHRHGPRSHSYLVAGAKFPPVGRKGQHAHRQIHKAADLQVHVAATRSLGCSHDVPTPDHVAIAAFHARSQREQKTKNNLDWGSLQSRLRTEMPPKPPGKLPNQPPITVFLKWIHWV